MEPSEEIRQWVGELMGMAPEEGGLSQLLEAWATLGPSLQTVHAATVPMETEPATQLSFPELEVSPPEGGRSNRE